MAVAPASNGETLMRKRPSLADLERPRLTESAGVAISETPREKAMPKTIYLHPAVLEQLEILCLQERPKRGKRKKFNTLVLEALDLLFKDRGLPSIEDMIREG
jgi:hypothetical protein